MRALRRATGVTTEYQRDSSSKRPVLSVTFVARAPPPLEAAAAVDAENAPTAAWKTRGPFSTAPTGT
jgi:hypothetical protein